MKNLYQWALMPLLCLILSAVNTNQLGGALPITNFTFKVSSNSVAFTNLSLDADSFLWFFGDGNTSTPAAPVHDFMAAGDYLVTLMVASDCGTDTLTALINIMTTSTEDINSTMILQISPNPNNGIFTLHLAGEPMDEIDLKVYDVLGQVVLSKAIGFGKGSFDGEIEIGVVSGLLLVGDFCKG